MHASSSARYREAEILTASPAQRVVMLYTHLLVNLRQGHAFLLQGKVEERIARLSKAHQVVEELLYSLDYEQGAEVAVNLGRLYEFWAEEILRLSRTPDAKRLARIVEQVAEMHEAWRTVAEEIAAAPVAAAR